MRKYRRERRSYSIPQLWNHSESQIEESKNWEKISFLDTEVAADFMTLQLHVWRKNMREKNT